MSIRARASNAAAGQKTHFEGDRLVAAVGGQGGSVGYVTTDQINTPRAITNSSGSV